MIAITIPNPWYNKIQPVSWYLEEHVKHGKEELNFSEFKKNSVRSKSSKLKFIIREVDQENSVGFLYLYA